MLRQIILDTETTGLSPKDGHRVIEIGCLEMINRRLTGEQFHVYINPEREIERGAEQVHGITQTFLSDKPLFIDIADEFIEFVQDAELIIHNAPFDVGFLNHEFKLLKKRLKPIDQMCSVTDTLLLARKKHPGQPNSLDALCRRYHVDNSNRDLHGALLDAELLAQVYLLLTGGQEQLFAASTNADLSKLSGQKIQRINENRGKLPVIMANEQELSAHQQFVEEILCVDS